MIKSFNSVPLTDSSSLTFLKFNSDDLSTSIFPWLLNIISLTSELLKSITELFLKLTVVPSSVNARPILPVIVSLELSTVRFNPPVLLLIPLLNPFIFTVEFFILIVPSTNPRAAFSKFKVESVIFIFPACPLLDLITPPDKLFSFFAVKTELFSTFNTLSLYT